MKRQQIRRMILLISFMLFPVTMWYFSPYLIIVAMAQHVLNGSFWVFLAMLVLSMFCGRAFCGWLCPAGGLQECSASIRETPAKQGWRNYIKYGIWSVWMLAVIVTFILGKNGVTVDFFFMTDHGISVTEIYNYVIYYGVLFLLFLPTVIHGKRAACHYLCWMAPFMVIGGFIGRKLHLPQLHIEADREACISCKQCSKACPMGLHVEELVKEGQNASCPECIQCGACIDNCPKHVLKYAMRWRKR